MRSVLGRLDAIAEILQIGSLLGALVPGMDIEGTLGVTVGAVIYCWENAGSIP
jgi:hypothetical protein